MKILELALLISAVCVVGICGTATSVVAHHGTAGYDMDKVTTVSGTVTQFDWSNPHVVIYLDAKRTGGEMEHWTIEMAAPIHMSRFGWSKSSMKAGDQIVADTHASKNGAPIGTSGTAGGLLKISINGQALPTH